MDFELSEEETAISQLARQIIGDKVTSSRLSELGSDFDRETWEQLAKANLLGISLSEQQGGSGLGFLATATILEEVGRFAAPLPILSTIVMGAMPIDFFGNERIKAELIPSVIAGEIILTGALVEYDGTSRVPTMKAFKEAEGWRLQGTKICVPNGMDAHFALVPAATQSGGVGIFIVDLNDKGVTRVGQTNTSGQLEARIELADCYVGPDRVLGDPQADPGRGAEIVTWIEERTIAGICMITAGLCQEALRLTAEYAKTREQFERPIGSFQAVAQRCADAYIDTEGIRLTALQAAWRLDAGMDATKAVAIAKYWASDAGQRVLLAAQHIHGGVGVDRDYPLHRYFLAAKVAELTLGGASMHLSHLGEILAQEPV